MAQTPKSSLFSFSSRNLMPNTCSRVKKSLWPKYLILFILMMMTDMLIHFVAWERHYTHEVPAYNMLSKWQGTLIPKLYGSYTLDIPVEGFGARVVRLILIEYIPGISMREVNPGHFSPRARQWMIKSIIDFESRVYGTRDILLQDLSPRNVIITKPNDDRDDLAPKLVFIDFADALFNRRRDDPIWLRAKLFNGQYVSPLLRWSRSKATREFNE